MKYRCFHGNEKVNKTSRSEYCIIVLLLEQIIKSKRQEPVRVCKILKKLTQNIQRVQTKCLYNFKACIQAE